VKKKKMNTKILVALTIAFALVGLTGAASAAEYNINGSYTYYDGAVDNFDAYTFLDTELTGIIDGKPMQMHSWVENDVSVTSVSSDGSNVPFSSMQGGGNTLTIITRPSRLNTFASSATAIQSVAYVSEGDAFEINFDGTSVTHEGTHYGILPLFVDVWDHNKVNGGAEVSYSEAGPMASIKGGNFGYVCDSNANVNMEAEHMLGTTAGSGITAWSEAGGEIWGSGGSITTDVDGTQDVTVNWYIP
jgi:hypothetical protein